MVYTYWIETATSYTEASPLETPLRLTRGYITQVGVFFPPGSAGLLRLKLMQGAHQVFPFNTDEYLRGDGYYAVFNELIPVQSAPFLLTAVSWNGDDTYEHRVVIFLTLQRRAYIERLLDWAK